VQARVLHGYGSVPPDRVAALYQDAVQAAAVAGCSDVESLVAEARAFIGHELASWPVTIRTAPSDWPDYPEAYLRTVPPNHRTAYLAWRKGGYQEAIKATGAKFGTIRQWLYRLYLKYKLWIDRLPYDPIVEGVLGRLHGILGEIYRLHYRDGYRNKDIARILGIKPWDVANRMRTVRKRLPYGGRKAPKGGEPIRMRSVTLVRQTPSGFHRIASFHFPQK